MATRSNRSVILATAAVVTMFWCAPAVAQEGPPTTGGIGTNGRPIGTPSRPSPQLKTPLVPGPWTGAKTPDGQPDVQGWWRSDSSGLTHSLEEGEDPGDDPTERAAAPAPTVLYDPADHRYPYQSWALAKKRQSLVDLETPTSRDQIDPDDKCWQPGVPRAVYSRSFNAMQITQTPGYVLMYYPSGHVFRIITLDNRPKVGEGVRLLMGQSRGKWEGNTLVIETTNQDANWLDSHGSFYSPSIHVVERWMFDGKSRISVDFLVEDPTVFTKPWRARIEHAPMKVEEDILWEQACFEGEGNVDRIIAIGAKMKAAGKTGIHTHNLPASIK